MTGYYDYVLGAIPLTLFGITGLLTVGGLSVSMAVPLAATVAVGLIAHALFVNGPVDDLPTVDEVTTPAPATRNAPTTGPVNAD